RARANAGEAQPRPYLAVALAVKAESGDLSADMFRQLRVRTCSDGTRTTRDRVRPRLAAKTINASARDVPHARNSRQTIMPSKRGRERLAHRLGLLRAKGRLPSMAAILIPEELLSLPYDSETANIPKMIAR